MMSLDKPGTGIRVFFSGTCSVIVITSFVAYKASVVKRRRTRATGLGGRGNEFGRRDGRNSRILGN